MKKCSSGLIRQEQYKSSCDDSEQGCEGICEKKSEKSKRCEEQKVWNQIKIWTLTSLRELLLINLLRTISTSPDPVLYPKFDHHTA